MRKLIALAIQASFVATLGLYPLSAQAAPPMAPSRTATTGSTGASNPSLDLSSSQTGYTSPAAANIRLGGTIGANGDVTGGTLKSVNAHDGLTAAEYMAVNQLQSLGSQRLLLSADRVAAGGYATLLPTAIGNLSELLIPKNVSVAALGFGANSPLNVTGTATIGGALYALQTQPNIASVLNFGTLNILPGGLLSGNLPTSFSVPGAYASALQINVANNLVNSSVISGSTVNITAGGSVFNQSATGSPASIVADTLNIFSGSGVIVNSGSMVANNALNLSTSDSQSLFVNNKDGLLKSAGDINFRDMLSHATGATNIQGGNIEAASQVNIFGGAGNVKMETNNLLGTLNVVGETARVETSTPVLHLGCQSVAGDPTYYNSGGDIVIDGSLNTLGQPIAILASGNITTGNNANQQIITQGAPILLVAGASITGGSGGGPTTSGQGAGDPGTFIINGPSGTGGFIDLTTGTGLVAMDSTPVAANANGGNVTLVAMGANANITLPGGLVIRSGGTGTGTNGSVTMIANGNIGSVNVNTTGGSGTNANGTSGNVSLTSGVAVGGVSEINGALQGSFGLASYSNGTIGVTNLTTPNTARIDVNSNGTKTLSGASWNLGARQFVFNGTGTNNLNATAGGITFGSGQLLNQGTGALNVNATGTIDFTTPIGLGTIPINSNGATTVIGNTINLAAAGTLNLRSAGSADGNFISGINLTGLNGVTFPGGGNTLTINYIGNGGSIYDYTVGTSFSGINGTNLRVNSGGDIHFGSHNFNNFGGSITASVPTTGYYLTLFDVDGPSLARFSNINTSGGALEFWTQGIVSLNGSITNGGAPANMGGIQVVAGYWCGGLCANNATGIIVESGANVLATNQLISLTVSNVQTSPPANPGVPVIDIRAGSTVLSTGTFFNNTLTGAGVELNVGVTTSPSLLSMLSLRNAAPNSFGYPYPNYGQFQNLPGGITQSPGSFAMQFGGGTGVMLADQGGVVVQSIGATPNLVAGAGRLWAHGGVVFVGGSSYAGEIVINGNVTADASLPPPLPPPPPPPPPPPRPLPVIEPPTAITLTDELTDTSSTILPTDTTKFVVTSQSNSLNSNQNNGNSVAVTDMKSGITTVVLTACQPFIFGDDPKQQSKRNTVAVAAAGSAVSTDNDVADNRGVDLHEGKMVVAAGKGGFSVATSKGVNVVIPENATAIVERTRSGQVVVTSLTGPSAQVTVGDKVTGKTFDVSSGQEIAVADDEILIPADAEDQTLQIEATLVVSNKNVQRRKFNIEKRIGRERILVCAQGGSAVELNERLHKKIEQLRNSTAETEIEKQLNKDLSKSEHLSPVAYVTPATPHKPLGLIKTEETSTASVKYLRGPKVDFTATNDLITLNKGEFVVSAHKLTKLLVGEHPFSVDPGAIVLVNAKDTAITVSDLYELKHNSVHGTVLKQKVTLNAGFEVVFGYKGSILHALQQDSVARRSLVDYSNSERKTPIASCEFSYASLFTSNPLLGKLAKNDLPENRAIIAKTMKMAAAVSIVTARRGPFAKVSEYNEYDK